MNPRALVFDAYGTLFDVHSVVRACESFWPGEGARISQLWRAKQLEWTWQRSLMRRYVPFSRITRDALGYACAVQRVPLDEAQANRLMQEYLALALTCTMRSPCSARRDASWRSSRTARPT
jgi:2-haloacid dehalogenase